jgi:signal transduction histidine kinase
MTLGLVTCSSDGKIMYVNPAFRFLVGLEEKALLEQKLINFYSRESQNHLIEISNLVLSSNAEEKPHVENAFPFYQQRQKIGYFLVHADLRVMKKLERLKADFNSMIVHDLRSPMNVIQGFIELIRTKVVGEINSEQEELLDIAKENVKKVLTLVDNFLVASKLEVGKFSIEPKVSEIHSLIERIIENHVVLMDNKKITLDSELNKNLPLLYFDSLRLEQVLNNLLSNAIKFTPENGRVWVTTSLFQKKLKGEDKMFAQIGVHDTGPGIPEEKLKYVFEKYEQVDSENSMKSSGTGLGLSICKEIINLHGGEIWVESEVKKGSHFYFSLPIEPSMDKLLK